MHKKGTFTDDQVNEIHNILQIFHGRLEWGGDWDDPIDEMHIEYVGD